MSPPPGDSALLREIEFEVGEELALAETIESAKEATAAPSGEAVARIAGATPLTADELGSPWPHGAPLWLDILKKAEHRGDGDRLGPASPQRPPGGAEPAIATAARETTSAGKAVMTLQAASNIVVRAALSPADGYRILALPYPVEYHAFWRMLAGMGVTQERLMDRMGASP